MEKLRSQPGTTPPTSTSPCCPTRTWSKPSAALHARTDIRLRLELRGDLLHIAVRDGSPRLLRLVSPDRQDQGGRGLWLVEQLARAWGVYPHPDGGKVVWCTLNL